MMPEDLREEHFGLCAQCKHVRLIYSDRGACFYQCSRALTDPTYTHYPVLPKRECPGFEENRHPPENP